MRVVLLVVLAAGVVLGVGCGKPQPSVSSFKERAARTEKGKGVSVDPSHKPGDLSDNGVREI
jgi:hypothetical protein